MRQQTLFITFVCLRSSAKQQQQQQNNNKKQKQKTPPNVSDEKLACAAFFPYTGTYCHTDHKRSVTRHSDISTCKVEFECHVMKIQPKVIPIWDCRQLNNRFAFAPTFQLEQLSCQ